LSGADNCAMVADLAWPMYCTDNCLCIPLPSRVTHSCDAVVRHQENVNEKTWFIFHIQAQRTTKKCWHTAGKYTVPILWDKKEKTIVNNESSEIMRMFNRYSWKPLSACFAHCWGMQPSLLWYGFCCKSCADYF